VHVFGRRGPAYVKFTPIELRELGDVPDVDVIVYAEDFAIDDDTHATELIAGNNQLKVMTRTLTGWLDREPTGASRRLHLHFNHAPVEVHGDGRVEGMRFERTAPTGDGGVRGTGEIIDYPLQAIYRAVGYFGSPLPGVPFDEARGVIPNDAGRVVDASGSAIPDLYATGWIKRGPVGLIGHTKSDATETIAQLVADAGAPGSPGGTPAGTLAAPAAGDPAAIIDLLDARGIRFTTWNGWLDLDAHERALGEAFALPDADATRERVKVVPRDEQVAIARNEPAESLELELT
jgi:ferredoxin/flavodoxin---NADP+ reductase